jgi:hypothetical protein
MADCYAFCQGCVKAEAVDLDGLHPYVLTVDACGIYDDPKFVVRRGGCVFNIDNNK